MEKNLNPRVDFPDHKGYILLLQLRTIYSQLKAYRQKPGLVKGCLINRCECGEFENTEQFLLGCQLYDDQRLEVLHTFHSQVETTSLDTLELLSYEHKEDFKGC